MTVFRQSDFKLESDCILAKVVVFGKMVVFGQGRCIRARAIVFALK